MPNRETVRKRTLLHESNMPADTNKEDNMQKDIPPIAAALAKCSIDTTELSSQKSYTVEEIRDYISCREQSKPTAHLDLTTEDAQKLLDSGDEVTLLVGLKYFGQLDPTIAQQICDIGSIAVPFQLKRFPGINYDDITKRMTQAGHKWVSQVGLENFKELNDELAAKAGPFKTVEELEDDIKREITKQKETEATEKLKDDLVAELVEKSTVPVPDVLLKDQMKLIEQDTNRNLMYRGMSIDDYIKSLKYKDKNDWLENEVRPIAEKRVKAGLLLAELSKVEKIEATENELLEKINQLGKQYPSEDMRKHLKTPEVQRDVANRILTEKTVDRLVSLNSKK